MLQKLMRGRDLGQQRLQPLAWSKGRGQRLLQSRSCWLVQAAGVQPGPSRSGCSLQQLLSRRQLLRAWLTPLRVQQPRGTQIRLAVSHTALQLQQGCLALCSGPP